MQLMQNNFWCGKVAAAFVVVTVLVSNCVGVVGVLAALLVTAALQHRRHLVNVVKTLPRDLWYLWSFIQVTRLIKRYERENATVVSSLEEQALRTPGKKCLIFEGKIWTYRDVDQYSNRVARAMHRAGVVPGDVVALMLGNRVEYICIWLGLAKLGAVTALINTNVRDAPLAHTINSARSKVVLFGEEYSQAVDGVRSELGTVEAFYQFGGASLPEWSQDMLPLLDKESADKPVVSHTPGHYDSLLYIYTSGTTGLPKPSIVTHAKVMFWPTGIMRMAGLSPDKDLHYCPLPIYHSAGGAYAISLAVVHGVPVALTTKFSASKYFEDCIKYGATSAQYIGELCRFLVLSKESPRDKQHRVRVLIGNGLSPGVWRRVQERFGIPQIVELYGATEGNVMMANTDQTVGAMGFMPLLVPRRFQPMDVIRVDEESMEPIRDDVAELCIRCKEGEPGMLIGKIDDKIVHRQFPGYLDKEATKKKTISDVFGVGDRYFVSGDLAVVDEMGYVYFKDRVGDTFRWKGENVSTTEVEAVMTRILLPCGVREVAAYGVQVPGHEGRAGMVAIADPERLADLRHLAQQLSKSLPAYARPVFLRVSDALPVTGTQKVTKVQLKREGFENTPDKDIVYVFDSRTGAYVRLTEALVEDIRANRLRV